MSRSLSAALVVAALAAGIQSWRLANEQADHANTRRQHAEQMIDLEREARRATDAAREEEQRRTTEVQKVAHEAHEALERARADAAAAADAGDRLRKRIAALTAARCASPGNTATANGSAPADTTERMLADVSRRIDEATDRIAEFATRAHTAGLACQRSYDALTP